MRDPPHRLHPLTTNDIPLAIRHRQNTDSASDSRQTAPTTPMTNLLAASLRLALNV